MSRILKFIRNNRRDLFIFLIFFVVSLVVVYILPREGRFRYEYQKGSIWKHDPLLAPFSFPVYRAQEEINRERDSVLRHFKPVYNYDTGAAQKYINEFGADFSRLWLDYSMNTLNIPSAEIYHSDRQYESNRRLEVLYLTSLTAFMEEIFDQGIVDVMPDGSDGNETYDRITVVRNNVAEDYPVNGSLYTPKSAFEKMSGYSRDSLPKLNNLPSGRYDAFIRSFPYNNYLSANIFYDAETSSALRNDLINGISLTRGLIQEGQGIISRGELITPEKYLILESLRKEYEENIGLLAGNLVLIGKFILVFASFFVILLFLRNFREQVLDSYLRLSFILLTMILVILIASATISFRLVSIYIIPFAILPILLKTFFDARLALFVHIITVLLIGFFVPNGFEFVFLNVIAGMIAIISLTNEYRRSKIVVTGALVIMAYSIIYLGISIVQEGSLVQLEWQYFRWFGINGILILISYPLIYIFEKSFGFTSDATLMELSDSNQPLLRQLAELAPGTFQHSLQVANLAENAIFKIGGNPLLVRAGALYHDIGKMDNPRYFIENQSGGDNPHNDLEFEESAKFIIGHVQKGVILARKNKLPEVIVDFIRTHHGTSTVQYFYKSFLKKYPEAEVDINRFSYPGPKPMSKETAVVMMADSVEAASRSLENINEEAIDKLVESIISNQMRERQYDGAQITFKEIATIREVFRQRLRNIYHARITYPE
ncbi:MAG: HDIG domain-containing protein [Bacteroidales bacterium]|nr:HDIG domain-containing protein [Bacteroidales bacterium]